MMVQKSTIVPVAPATPYHQLNYSAHHDPRWAHEISLGRRVGLYRFSGDIGSGNFSQVKLAVHQLTKDKVAIKIIEKSKLDAKTRKMLSREISTMETIHHSNIIRLFEVIESYSKIHLVMEYAKGGELFNKISTEGRLTENEAKPLFFQVASAVQHLHSRGFIHRDIKAENVFYSGPNYVKLGDFGFSTQLTKGPDEHLNTFCGSPPYAAPELFRDQHYIGRRVDTWALGVLLYFVITGTMPFKANTVVALKNCILEGKYHIPSHVSDACGHIIESSLQQTPSDRISVDDILDSKWLSSVDPNNFCFGQERFMTQPTIGSDLIPLNPLEAKARKKLETYGISAKMLCDNVALSSKSAVIGIYRIIINRYQLETLGDLSDKRKDSSISDRKNLRKNSIKRVSKTCTIF